LRPQADEFAKAGARLAVIGNGWPAAAKHFAGKIGFPPSVAVLTDPSRRAYDLAGLKRSAVLTMGPHAWLPYARAIMKGFRQGRLQGDPWQQGGALVVGRTGTLSMKHVSMGPGHHADPRMLLEAVRREA
jgi:hypothetical protein